MTQFTIGKVAELAGVSRQTVRHYEKEGLLHPVQRTVSNYRLYGQAEVKRLLFIIRAKSWGLRLEDIKDILLLEDGSISQEKARQISQRNRLHIEKQVIKLTALSRLLARAEEENTGSGQMTADYPLIEIIG